MDTKIKNDIKALLKLGLSQEMAELIACANNGKPELVQDTVEALKEEQNEIRDALMKAGFEPFQPTMPLAIKNEESAQEECIAGSVPKQAELPNGRGLVYTA